MALTEVGRPPCGRHHLLTEDIMGSASSSSPCLDFPAMTDSAFSLKLLLSEDFITATGKETKTDTSVKSRWMAFWEIMPEADLWPKPCMHKTSLPGC